jgi:hypothetical protein
VAGTVVLVNQLMREGGFGHSLLILKGELNAYKY